MPYSLSWIGASGDCRNAQMNGQRVLAGTRLVVGLRQSQIALGHRPQFVSIYEDEEAVVGRLLRALGKSSRRLVTRLDLVPCSLTNGIVAKTPEWILVVPRVERGRSKVLCVLEDEQGAAEEYIISVAAKSVSRSDLKQHAALQVGGFDFADVSFTPASKRATRIEVIAAADPTVAITALTPHDRDFWSYLRNYLGTVAQAYGLNRQEFIQAFTRQYAPALNPLRPPAAVSVKPGILHVEAGETATFEVIQDETQTQRRLIRSALPIAATVGHLVWPFGILSFAASVVSEAVGRAFGIVYPETMVVLRLRDDETGITVHSDFMLLHPTLGLLPATASATSSINR